MSAGPGRTPILARRWLVRNLIVEAEFKQTLDDDLPARH